MLSEAKKQLSPHSWNQVQHSLYEGVTTAKVCMDHIHNLSAHNKCPDSLERSLTDIISPVVRSKGYM